ncbi:tripartite tricarboxylate transporter substrate binding protein [Roseinatronobacter bogoriensis]|nr:MULTISPECIES: tripartite tricarboxylate transporter substrate-binding protein [Rhodobaca]MBB4209707.1 putative tricarboxylic transport membrane protein [Rhodobaca bogoriensis DSM 18756]
MKRRNDGQLSGIKWEEKEMKRLTLNSMALLAGALLAAPVLADEAPEGPLEIVVGAGPGGGYDRLARAIQEVLDTEGIIPNTINLTYQPGAGGAVAWATVNRSAGDMTKISIFSPNIVTGEVLGTDTISFSDMTMLSMLVFEDGCFAVNPDAEINSAEKLIEALQDDANNVRFGFAVSAGNQWHVAMARLVEAVGADVSRLRSTVFDSGGRAVAALLGEHVDVVATGCAQFAQYHEAGDLTVIGVSAPERMGGVLADVPTWQEQGHDVVWGAWRGILAPRDLTESQISWWEEKLRAVTESSAWIPVAEENYWRTAFLNSADTTEMLVAEREEYGRALRALGLIE